MTNEEIFNNNINIAYEIVKKYNPTTEYDKDDLKQIALLGLWKAIINYNGKYAFSTFAYRVITNELNYNLRRLNKFFKANIVNLEDNINDTEKLCFNDILFDEDYDVEEIFMINRIKEIENEEVSKLNETHKKVYTLLKLGKNQNEIAIELNITQPTVCRIQQKVFNKIKNKCKVVGIC